MARVPRYIYRLLPLCLCMSRAFHAAACRCGHGKSHVPVVLEKGGSRGLLSFRWFTSSTTSSSVSPSSKARSRSHHPYKRTLPAAPRSSNMHTTPPHNHRNPHAPVPASPGHGPRHDPRQVEQRAGRTRLEGRKEPASLSTQYVAGAGEYPSAMFP